MMQIQIKATSCFSLNNLLGLRQSAMLLLIAGLAGCAAPEPKVDTVFEPLSVPSSHCEELKNENARLEKLVAEKDELIKNQKMQQQSQAQVLHEAKKEATRAQVKLHRLATKPSTASAIAEVEASLEQWKQAKLSPFDQILRFQVQHLLETASLFYSKDQYAAAMNHVSQANNFIHLITDHSRKKVSHIDHTLLEFHVPVKLRTKKNAHLRKSPDAHAQVIVTLKKDVIVTATANQGDWLRVQTDKSQGWIINSMLELEEERKQ